MKDILIVLLLIAVVILVFGAVNQDQQIDFDYIAGTWRQVSVLSLAGIAAGVVFFVGLGAAVAARYHVLSDRRKLEKELQEVYVRLRAAERAAGAAEERRGLDVTSARTSAVDETGTPQGSETREWAPLPIVPGRSEEVTTVMASPTGREEEAGVVGPASGAPDAITRGRTEALTTELPAVPEPEPGEGRRSRQPLAGEGPKSEGAGSPEALGDETSRPADETPGG